MDKSKRSNRITEETTIPMIEEQLQVGKRTVETGVTRVRKNVRSVEQLVEEPLMREVVEVQRVPVNLILEAPVATRTEGETTIIPVMEEVLVVEKKVRLKEEIRITRRREVVTHRQKEVVRQEEAVVEHGETEH